MQFLERVGVAEFARQPIEQLRVRWPAAVAAEIVGRIDEALAEVVLPEAIGDAAPGEDVGVVGDPVGEGGAIGAFLRGLTPPAYLEVVVELEQAQTAG